jgi:hypothetical protein
MPTNNLTEDYRSENQRILGLPHPPIVASHGHLWNKIQIVR